MGARGTKEKEMSTGQNNIFDIWIREAMDEVSNHGWREAGQNAVTLAAFGMIINGINKKVDRIIKPAWTIALSVVGGAVWWIASTILGL